MEMPSVDKSKSFLTQYTSIREISNDTQNTGQLTDVMHRIGDGGVNIYLYTDKTKQDCWLTLEVQYS
jgi:hypothetical protein